MSTSGKPSTDPANPTESHAESADRHNANKARSAANLDEARRRATQKRNYNSDATRSRLRELFAETWHCEPRSWQIDITEAILLGLDSVLIAGTGSGKTMPFMLTLKYDTAATVLVISPLKILQEDQACRFCAAGIPSCAVNGDTYGAVRKDLESMQYRALLTSPEMCLETDSFRKFLTSPGLQKSVRAVIIDEAHCIAQWGGDFRKHYGMLHKLRALFPATVPFLAATATLPPLALKEVCDKLHIDLDESYFVNLGNDRHNISQHVRFINSARDYSALKDLLSVDAQERKDLVKTIVFVNSRNGTQEVCREVRRLLPRRLRRYVDFLHAVRKDWTKRKIMQRFRRGRIRILIATEAAGMGADIPDIIQVIQLGAPSSLSVYLQRAGRAVRDVVLQGRAFLLVEKSAFKLQKRKPPKKKAADDWSDDEDLDLDCDGERDDAEIVPITAPAMLVQSNADDHGDGGVQVAGANAAPDDTTSTADGLEGFAANPGASDCAAAGLKQAKRIPGSQMAWGKVIHPSLRTYITHPSCRRDTSDAYFDNPPRQRQPSGSCCDICEGTAPPIPGTELPACPPASDADDLISTATSFSPDIAPVFTQHLVPHGRPATPPSRRSEDITRPVTPTQSQHSTPATTPQKTGKRMMGKPARKEPVRRGELLKRVRVALQQWRRTTRARDYPYSPLPAKALLPEQTLTKLASSNKILTPTDLGAVEPPWVYREKYGIEVLVLIRAVVDNFVSERDSNKKARRATKAKATKAKQDSARRVEAAAAAERKRTRDADRERARVAKAELEEEDKRRAKAERERAKAQKDDKKALYASNYARRHKLQAGVKEPQQASCAGSVTVFSPSTPSLVPDRSTSLSVRSPLTPAPSHHPGLTTSTHL